MVHDAHLLEEAGCFAIVLEKIPAALAARVAQEVSIPVIGIGAGGGVDGQVLVIHDMLGINQEFSPRFLRRYHNLYAEISGAVGNYIRNFFPALSGTTTATKESSHLQILLGMSSNIFQP